MRYFKIFDEFAPEGQLFRLNGNILEVEHEVQGQWVESAWTRIYGESGITMLFNLHGKGGTRIVDVEV